MAFSAEPETVYVRMPVPSEEVTPLLRNMAILTKCALRLEKVPRYKIVGSLWQHLLYAVVLTCFISLPRLAARYVSPPHVHSFTCAITVLFVSNLVVTILCMGLFCYTNWYIIKPDVGILDYMIFTSALTYMPLHRALVLAIPQVRIFLFAAAAAASAYYLNVCYRSVLLLHRMEGKVLHFLYMAVVMGAIMVGLDMV